MTLSEIAFPYRANRQFGVASFALVFVTLVIETELLVAAGFALAQQLGLYLTFQSLFFPVIVLVSLFVSAVFTFRTRSWTRQRLVLAASYGAGAAAYGERLAKRAR